MNSKSTAIVSRRAFLAAVSASAASPLMAGARAPELAIHGGSPVRSTPLTTQGEGANFIGEEERSEVCDALETRSLFRFGGFTTPKKASTLEEEFARFLGVKYALGVTSGTAALHVALNALGVGPGDEVILPAETWYSDYNATIMTGALPVFAEIDETFTMDPEDLKRKITPQTKVIMPSHLSGTVANMDKIMAIAREHKVKVLEDSAEAIGAQYKGNRTGTIGDIGIYSFQSAKMMTSGEGGAVVTNDPLLFERAIRFHDIGEVRSFFKPTLGQSPDKYGGKAGLEEGDYFTLIGLNYRLNEETGAILCAQVRKLESLIDNHRRMYRYVTEKLQSVPGIKIRPSNDPEGQLGISLDLLLPSQEIRDKFLKAMAAENVPMRIGIQGTDVLPNRTYIVNKIVPHPNWPTFNTPRGKSIQYGAECCPRTLDMKNRYASMYLGPKWTDEDLDAVVTAVTKVHQALVV